MITRAEIIEYNELKELLSKTIDRMKEIDSKTPKNSKGGGNYNRKTPERDTNTYLPI